MSATACVNCGYVERIYFECPACGRSFEVASEKSQRIFCSHFCKRLAAAGLCSEEEA